MKAQPLVWSGDVQPAARVDDWPNPPRRLKTVVMHTDDYVGVITIQATLHPEPTEADWFTVHEEMFVRAQIREERARNRTYNSRDRYVWMRATLMTISGRVDRVMVL